MPVGPLNRDRVAALDPVRQRQAGQCLAIDPRDAGEVGVLDAGGGILQVGLLQQARALAITTQIQLAVDQ